jgi:hypothetical protein
MKIFHKFWGSWPGWLGELDDGSIVYVRIRYGAVCIGEGDTELLAYDNAEQFKWAEIYQGVSDAVDALFELRENGYYFVPPNHRQGGEENESR